MSNVKVMCTSCHSLKSWTQVWPLSKQISSYDVYMLTETEIGMCEESKGFNESSRET